MNSNDVYALTTDMPGLLVEDDVLIARFFDAKKVNLLIENPGIWFSRFDKMSDDREGAYFNRFIPEDFALSDIQMDTLQRGQRNVHMPLISCWTLFDSGEDKRMWNTFGPGAGSICCVTTPKRLSGSLAVDGIPCGLVRYYAVPELNERNDPSRIVKPAFYMSNHIETPVYHSAEFAKRDCFAAEKEVRFICFGDGASMFASNEDGRLVRFKDLRITLPFLRIIARPDIKPEVLAKLQSLFGCSVSKSEIAGCGVS